MNEPVNIEPAPPPHHCRRCGKVLNALRQGGEVQWLHGQLADVDHEPDPVPTIEEPARRRLLCDFCGARDPQWGYRSADFAMGGDQRQRAGTDWTACDDCAELIDADNWDRLADRAARAYARKTGAPRKAIRPQVAALHRQFRTAKTSGRLAVGDVGSG